MHRWQPGLRARWLFVAGLLAASAAPAWAVCTTVGLTVTCNSPAFALAPSFSSNTDNLTVNVTPTGTVGVLLGLLGNAATLTGNNVTLNNAGLIDPSLLGIGSLLSSGVVIGNAGPSTVSIDNSGTLRGTSGLLGVSIGNLNGLALAVQNGPTGTTSIVNSGSIGSTPLFGLTLFGSDAPVVAAYGGATVSVVNTGTLTGRVAFERSAAGNSFVNAGTINGGVSMGAAGTNLFTAVTGSQVTSGGSLGLNVLNVIGLNLGFGATGVIDGGAGGDNELRLQNAATGTGSGTTGNGTLPSGTYINFNRLTVNSGTWTLNGGPTVAGTHTLNGGLVNFDNGGVFGAAAVVANGGAIAPSVAGLSVANDFALSGAGLVVQGPNNLALGGVLSGTGALSHNGSGTLLLGGSNNYQGGTDLAAGTLQLGTATGLGAGALRATGGGTLDVLPAATLANDIVLGGNLGLSGRSALTLTGAISGAGAITKNGAADLTLSGGNSFDGGLTLGAGRLTVGNGSALGTGALRAGANTTLDASAAVSLANAVDLAGPLTIGGSNALTLAGPVGGAGGLVKNGAADLGLSGANGFAGGVALNAGRLVVGSPTALGTGALTAAAGTTLDASAPVSLANNVSLLGNLTLGGGSALTLSGNLSGAGGLIKAGAADSTLSGANGFTGAVSVAAGALNTVGNAALGSTSGIDIGAGATLRLGGNATAGALTGAGALDVAAGATLTLGGTGLGSVFGGGLSGAGNLAKAGAGTLVLNGTGVVGSTSVAAGRLLVGDSTHAGASLGGTVSVASGATLGGTGTVGGNVTVDGGAVLSPGDGLGNLRVGGTLTMAQGSTLDIGLGTASGSNAVPGQSDSVSVAGDLLLNGSTLNLSDLGGYGPGLYRLFDYGGTLGTSNGGLALGTTPAGNAPIIQYLAGAKQINLINAAGSTLNMWNANGAASPTQMGGGSGTWSASTPVWTDAVGSVTAPMQPMPGFAIFGGQPGTVTVDNGAGAVSAQGLQFAVDGYQIAGGPLTLASSVATPVPRINVGDGSAAGAGYTATVASVLAGSAGLDKVGAGTLVLGAANTYTGNTVLTAGTLSVASDTALGAAANGLDFAGGALRVTGTGYTTTARQATLGAAGGTIDIADAGNSFSLARPLSGAGALVKAGAGTLVLAGTNSHAGGTTVSAGTLIGSATSFGSGAIVDNATLVIDQASDGTLANALSGSGSLTKAGAGNLTLAGNGAAFTGATDLSAGTLTVAGSLGGALAVANGATLAGTGTVGSTTVRAGGSIAPAGADIGALNIAGNLLFAPGSSYRVDLSPAASDQLRVSGSATLQGGTVEALGTGGGTWNPSTSYRIVEAAGGLSGSFAGVTSNFAFLTPSLAYDATSASLTLARNDISFPSVGATPNQSAAGAGAESLPTDSPLYGAVVQLDRSSARSAFEQLSGDTHATLLASTLEGSHFVRDAVIDQLRLGEGAAAKPADASAQSEGGRNLWARTFGSWGRIEGNGSAARTESSVGGVFIGADTMVGGGWRVGAVGGYSRGSYDTDERRTTGKDDAYHLGVYGGRQWDRLALRLGAFYTRHDLETTRTLVFPGVADTLRADYDARTAQVFGELGYRIDAGAVALEPFANLAYVNLRSDAFTERGGASALSSRGETMELGFTTLGLRASTPLSAGRADLTLRGMVGWRHALGEVVPTSTFAFVGGRDFAVAGLPVARNALVLEAGVDMSVARDLTLGVGYVGQAGDGVRDHGLKANLTWRF